MSDADNQMGGTGGESGHDPAEESDDAPDEVTGNTAGDDGLEEGNPT